ncbi:hypothetical protein FA15DRAFT_664544 [Coprinopsis marcescibilis]|uniref:GST N-terminal domain-containing protein n=1 Tax=Coprinopsis marcescibilis TaxID=230819 RepID=A0A5C3LJV9_COPMA|nr:hypothetical protein FA15DRAFT_664544 [Coprinopsis marcescibilis]
MLTFYDITCPPPQATKSANTWKTRLSLNYKGLPYKTETIEYADIADFYKKNGIPPAVVYPNGFALHTLPVIKDDSSGQDVFVVDSLEIAKYLDKTYPDTPRLIPEGAEAQVKAFQDQLSAAIVPVIPLVFKLSAPQTTEYSREYFNKTRARDLSALFPDKPVSSLEELEITPEEIQAKFGYLQQTFDALSNQYGGKETFHWAFGAQITFADFILAGMLLNTQSLFGKDSLQWQGMSTWNDGKWKTFLQNLGPYQSQEN